MKAKFNAIKPLVAALAVTLFALGGPSVKAATVQNLHDSGPGSLRDAILNAATDPTINFDPGVIGTIVLTNGELQITSAVTINGPGANVLTISSPSTWRVLHVFPAVTANVSGLTLQNGWAQGLSTVGGGVFNQGTLSLSQCGIVGCSAHGAGGGAGMGGGVYSTGPLAMTACTISYCLATAADGSSGSGFGGGLYVTDALALTNCTLAWNEATGGLPGGASLGGGIYCDNNLSASRTMVNCTVSGNQAGNVGHFDSGAEGNDGGGIATDSLGNLHMINCIALGNYNVCCFEDVRGRESRIQGSITSGGGNLFYSGDPTASGYSVNGDGSIDFSGGSVDSVRLGVLRNNGGPTPTMSIGKAGAAYDNGNDAVTDAPYSLATDQRGFARLQNFHVDVGAYEAPGNICPLCLICYNCAGIGWLNGGSGLWDFGSNWDGGAPGDGSSVLITNSGTKTITIDSSTASNFMSVSNLWVSAPSNSVNTLLLNAGLATPFRIHDNFFVLSGGALSVSNSAIQMNPGSPPTNAFANDSSVILDGPATFYNNATLDTANAFDLTIGNSAPGSLGMTNSTLYAYDLFVGAGSSGTANLNNTTALLNRSLFLATATGKTGIVNIVGGVFIATNNVSTNTPSLVFDRGIGQMTISSGATVRFGSALLGAFGGTATFTEQIADVACFGPLQLENGTLTLQEGSTLSLGSSLILAAGSNSVAQVNITGGTSSGGMLNVTNGPILIGPGGNGQMTISRGTVTAQTVKLGGTTPGASGLLHLTGSGTLRVLGSGGCDACGITANDGEQDGGTLDASQTSILIGQDHNARYNLSGGTAIANKMFVGYSPGFTGAFTQSGGLLTVTTSLIVGDCVSNAAGLATLSGSAMLFVTNAAHTAVLDVRNGTLTMNGGTLVVDTLIITNPCAHFVHNGGTLIYNQLTLDPNLDADGDGVPNGVEQTYGLDPLTENPVYTVVNNNDSGAGSLRAALASASAVTNPVITFAGNVTGTITLTSGELFLSSPPDSTYGSMTVLGPGAKVLAVSGNAASRVFNIGTRRAVNLLGLTITNGLASGSRGGGILNNYATLTLGGCAIRGNRAQQGGGLYNYASGAGSGVLRVVNCTISGNAANSIGGGIVNDGSSGGDATLAITNSTLSGNSGVAGAIYNDGQSSGHATLRVFSSTLSGNTSVSGFPDNVLNEAFSGNASLEMGGSLFTAGPNGNFYNDAGTVTSCGFNLSSDAAGGDGTHGPGGLLNGPADQRNTDPLLDPAGLRDNGGDTPTIALLPGSPAVDAGKSFGLGTDQRGRTRPFDIPGVANAGSGDGSDIGAFELIPPALSIIGTGASVIISWPSPSPGFVPQQNNSVASPNGWSNFGGMINDNGIVKSITINPPVGNLFFRLKGQ